MQRSRAPWRRASLFAMAVQWGDLAAATRDARIKTSAISGDADDMRFAHARIEPSKSARPSANSQDAPHTRLSASETTFRICLSSNWLSARLASTINDSMHESTASSNLTVVIGYLQRHEPRGAISKMKSVFANSEFHFAQL